MDDPKRMIWVFLMDDLMRANQRRNRQLPPLRLIGSLPYAEPRIAFEEPHDAAELFLPLRMLGVDFSQFLQKRRAVHAGMGSRFHILLFPLGPFRIPRGIFLALF